MTTLREKYLNQDLEFQSNIDEVQVEHQDRKLVLISFRNIWSSLKVWFLNNLWIRVNSTSRKPKRELKKINRLNLTQALQTPVRELKSSGNFSHRLRKYNNKDGKIWLSFNSI